MTNRREFIVQFGLATGALAASANAFAATPMVAETDPQAAGLGYKADASKVDKAKFATFKAGSACSNCALFQGKATDTAGGCGIFAGKNVAAKGWCSAYAKKA